MAELMIETARSEGVRTITLDSSLTAHEFYKKIGFQDSGPIKRTDIGGSSVRGYPMIMRLDKENTSRVSATSANQTITERRVFSGAPWEQGVGYCRAIRRGNIISVSGTAPVDDLGRLFAPNNAYAQATRCIEIIKKSLDQLGATLSDVMRTRMFVTDISRWEEFGRAHAEAFGNHPPATTMVEVKSLITPGMLIEIEADAVLDLKCSAGSLSSQS